MTLTLEPPTVDARPVELSAQRGAAPPSRPARRGHRLLRRLSRNVAVAAAAITVGAAARIVGLPSTVGVVAAIGAGFVVRQSLLHRPERRTTPSRILCCIAVLVAMSATSWSITGALTDPGSDPATDRMANWMRDHHMNLVVDTIEQHLNARPATNGAVDPTALPDASRTLAPAPTPAAAAPTAKPPPPPATAAPASTAPTTAAPLDHTPPSAGPLVDTTLAGEGQWTPNAREVNGVPTTYTTFVRPDPTHTGVVAAAVELDPAATRLVYVPGAQQPGGTGWAWGGRVPLDRRPALVAAFNAGWKQRDKPGGAYTEGRTAANLVDGKASIVIYADGHADIGSWSTDVAMTPDVVSVRQNLDLIVEMSQPVDGLTAGGTGRWGSDKYQTQYTRRSGLGVTSGGALVYVAGAGLSTATLATALIQVGAVRGMELDIHNQHPTFNFFTPAPGTINGVTGAKLLPDQVRPSTRYLQSDQRDFFALLAR